MTKNLNKLEKKRAQIDAQIADAKARQKESERKARTSRLVVMGALLEADMIANPDSQNTRRFQALIDEYTYADKHRQLFDLPILDKEERLARAKRAREKKVRFN